MVQKLKQVSDDWLKKSGKTETVFSQGMFLSGEIKKTTLLTIESSEKKVVAFLNLIQYYAPVEGTYNLVRITEDVSPGLCIYY